MRRIVTTRYAILSRAGIFLIFIATFVAACSAHPPEAGAVQTRLAVAPSERPGGVAESLSVFVAVRDEDGFADIESLYVIDDGNEVYWHLTPESWSVREENGETWIGANGLSTAEGKPLPRGQYRVLVVDKSGERSERPFTLAVPATANGTLPTLTVQDGIANVAAPYARTLLLFLDSGGETVQAAEVTSGSVSLDKTFGSDAWRKTTTAIVLYSFDPKTAIGWYSWKRAIE